MEVVGQPALRGNKFVIFWRLLFQYSLISNDHLKKRSKIMKILQQIRFIRSNKGFFLREALIL